MQYIKSYLGKGYSLPTAWRDEPFFLDWRHFLRSQVQLPLQGTREKLYKLLNGNSIESPKQSHILFRCQECSINRLN